MGIAPGSLFNGNTTREEGACVLGLVIPAAGIESAESPGRLVHGAVETAREVMLSSCLLGNPDKYAMCSFYCSLQSVLPAEGIPRNFLRGSGKD